MLVGGEREDFPQPGQGFRIRGWLPLSRNGRQLNDGSQPIGFAGCFLL